MCRRELMMVISLIDGDRVRRVSRSRLLGLLVQLPLSIMWMCGF